MGQEIECTMKRDGRRLAGKAYLETSYLLFRGEERLKIALKDIAAVSDVAGVLRLEFSGGLAEFELGSHAAQWARKILHPPSRMDKLGLKPGSSVRILGRFDPEFQRELQTGGAVITTGRSKADLLFFAAERAADLEKVPGLVKALQPSGALWIVYPKGIQAIRETEVIRAGRDAGLKDTKVAGFSPTHTALRFVIPVDRR